MTATPRLSDSQIQSALSLYGGPSSAGLYDAIRTYIDLLLRWNSRISLTTVTDPNEILRFHIGESIAAVSAVPIEKGRLADVGSGAGFPGVPLALFLPDLDVTLIESNAKKATFLSEVQRQLNLHRVRVFRGRAEELLSQGPKFDYVTGRAVGKYEELLLWSAKALNPGGKVILWLGDKDASEISAHPGWNWRVRRRSSAPRRDSYWSARCLRAHKDIGVPRGTSKSSSRSIRGRESISSKPKSQR